MKGCARALRALLFTFGLCTGAARADRGAPAPVVHERLDDGVFSIDGEVAFAPGISRAQVWNVVSDYEHLSDFISTIRESKIRGRRPGGAVVEQTAVGKWFLFSRSVSVLLDVRENALRSIAFRDVSHKDFTQYGGAWTLTETNGAVQLDYHLEAQPSAALPAFVIEKVFTEDASSLLEQVRKEILKRADHNPTGVNP